MSQTGSVAPQGDSEVQPLILYNCIHHREDNPIDCPADGMAEIAAQIYNAVIVNEFHIPDGRMDKIHPLNFASIGGSSGSLSGMLNRELDVLVNIARADAEAQAVLLRNYESLTNAMAAKVVDANAEVVATLGTLDAVIRQQSATVAFNRG